MALIRNEKLGDVFLREFDEGMAKSLGAQKIGGDYYLPVSSVSGVRAPIWTEYAPNAADVGTKMPGIPLIFGNPDDAHQRYVISCIRLRREDPSPALERWGSCHDKYKIPAPGATKSTVQYGGQRSKTGYDKYETKPEGKPYDIPYTLTVEASGDKARSQAQLLIRYCMGKFGAHGKVTVYDSEGAKRVYWVFGEGPSELTAVGDIRERTVIHALSLRVSGVLDVEEGQVSPATTSEPQLSFGQKE
jgi:hypothetical protein